MDTIVAGSSTNSRRSLSRSRVSTTTRNRPTPSLAEFTRSPTDDTSVTLTTDMSLQKVENALSDYGKGLSLLKHNPPEQRLDVHLPYSEYLKLEECWSKIRSARNISEDQRYPYLAYNTVARDSDCVPAVELGSTILTGARGYLSSHGAESLISTIKQADGTIKYKRPGAQAKVMIAIEDLWIEGQHVKVCILVCLDESPRFRNPDTRYEHVTNVDVEMDAMARCVAKSEERDSSQSYYGQIKYRGHRWVGDLTKAFIEVWRANKRQPARYQLIQNAWSSNRLPKSIGLKMSDFVPGEDLEVANIPDGSLSFNGNLYLHILRTSMGNTAEQRYHGFISG
ncbi:hypothetical protein POJ06DRAFT_279322 [Lipomyces tetrasporus]|uniref:Uncharacterized protein n=1 Tax=Lipomyces tetrasporus TaxID=54092 RepID=A0AAD7QY91_9ASCO|nr:uncharacterized protein POJ06DRAFT_279322 [Lipomyces tetrasporus]KAJ8103561.1 hypothetical protein POJ06DRAFT_279322 [Lipomyces tetrasporus]